ncbi:MAG: hypothetical protein ACOYNS_06315 [Bacteroidota bacterium]
MEHKNYGCSSTGTMMYGEVHQIFSSRFRQFIPHQIMFVPQNAAA